MTEELLAEFSGWCAVALCCEEGLAMHSITDTDEDTFLRMMSRAARYLTPDERSEERTTWQQRAAMAWRMAEECDQEMGR